MAENSPPGFGTLDISGPTMQAIEKMGYESPTPIQEEAIPLLLEGRDLIGQAQTGTGKTAAFGVLMCERTEALIDVKSDGKGDGKGADRRSAIGDPKGLVVTPTRELALQVAGELEKLGEFKGLRTLAVYGGQDIRVQLKALRRGVHFIVGTPGRLLDHFERRTIRTNDIRFVVLDEADRMLDMGFIEDLTRIIEALPKERQTMLFSATIPPVIRNIAKKFLKDPVYVSVSEDRLDVEAIKQYYYTVSHDDKPDALARIIDVERPELAMIFCNTRFEVKLVAQRLSRRGYRVEATHGDLTQKAREEIMDKFRVHAFDILVATDVAARGLDITGVSHVINYNVPERPEDYVHRIGRTGRAGKSGAAFTLASYQELGSIRKVRLFLKDTLEKREVPSDEEAIRLRGRGLVEIVDEILADLGHQPFRRDVEVLFENRDHADVLAALYKHYYIEGGGAVSARRDFFRNKNILDRSGPRRESRDGGGNKKGGRSRKR